MISSRRSFSARMPKTSRRAAGTMVLRAVEAPGERRHDPTG
jgi:hypothetical protein